MNLALFQLRESEQRTKKEAKGAVPEPGKEGFGTAFLYGADDSGKLTERNVEKGYQKDTSFCYDGDRKSRECWEVEL